MESRDALSVYGYIRRQNFERKCLIQGIIRTIIDFFKIKGGFLYVCGRNTNGQLGISEYYNKECMEPTLVPTVNEVVDIAALGGHTLLVDYKGSVWAFGCADCGKLGNENTDNVDVQTPQQINLKERAIAVSVGDDHSLILADNGAVLSCGSNMQGQLGYGGTETQSVPKVIEALKEQKITQICVGSLHSGALSEKGQVFMWGANHCGQCGVGKNKGDLIKTPMMIKLSEKASMIECGYYHSLLTTMNNLLYSFGYGNDYQLGHGIKQMKYVPTLIEIFKEVTIVNVAGGCHHTLCIDDELNVWAFGKNTVGQCAYSRTGYIQTPKTIEYFTTNKIKAKQVAAGHSSSCVISQANECFVFGKNNHYEIGLKNTNRYFMPTKLPLFVQKISMGGEYSTFIGYYKKE